MQKYPGEPAKNESDYDILGVDRKKINGYPRVLYIESMDIQGVLQRLYGYPGDPVQNEWISMGSCTECMDIQGSRAKNMDIQGV